MSQSPSSGPDNAKSEQNFADELWDAYEEATDGARATDDEIEQLGHERDFWKSMFNQLVAEYPAGILVTTEEGTVTHWNDMFSNHMNIPRSEALGENAYDVIGTEGESETLAETVARTGEVIEEDDIREVPTTDAIFQVHGVPLRGPAGTVIGGIRSRARRVRAHRTPARTRGTAGNRWRRSRPTASETLRIHRRSGVVHRGD